MKIIFLGAEVPSNRTLLETTGAKNVGFSFYRLLRRGLPKKGYLLENHFDEHFQIHVHPGLPDIHDLQLDEFSELYETFVADNMTRLASFSEIDVDDQEYVENQRKTCWAEVPPGKFLPIWNPKTGFKGLNELAERYLDIGLPGESLEEATQLAAVARTLARSGTRFHILGSARPDNLRSVPAESTTTMSWLSPMMNGETIVWDGTKLVRYPKRMKDQARARYRNVYQTAGVDVDLILEDDPKEVCRLAVWSYQQYEARLNGVNDDFLYINNDGMEVEQSGEETPSDIDKRPHQVRKLEARNPEEMGNLPVFGYDMDTVVEDDGTIKDVTVVQSQSTSLRVCDTCYVAANCPAFKPASTCAFKLPIEIKTKDQLKGLINAVIEMQGQRVAFMRFAEEMQGGGYSDPNLSQEIDRLFKLIKTTKELDDSREFIRMTVERQGSAGVLSSIFGDKANVLKELPNEGLNENQTTKIIKDLTEDS
jgi:hypothetical protein